MSNVMLDDNDKNPRRLFELIKKLYRIEEKDNDDDNNSSLVGNNEVYYRNQKIPNIIHLVGHIFGTEEEESSSLSSSSNENEKVVTEMKFLKDKKSFKYVGKQTQKERIEILHLLFLQLATMKKTIL